MTPNEFKKKYPEYSHLEGDVLWDKMTEVFINCSKKLTADPNREIHYHDPINIPNIGKILIEDESKTVWIDEEGNKVRYVVGKKFNKESLESFKFDIIDFSKND